MTKTYVESSEGFGPELVTLTVSQIDPVLLKQQYYQLCTLSMKYPSGTAEADLCEGLLGLLEGLFDENPDAFMGTEPEEDEYA